MKIATYMPYFFLFCSAFANAQQTYLQQKKQSNQASIENQQTNIDRAEFNAFVGCIDYKVVYEGVPKMNKEQRDKAEFIIENSTENLGVKRTHCFNERGDKLHIYHSAKLIDRIWYFADSNEEYTLFSNGVMKFMVNNEAEPDGFEGLAIAKFRKTDNRRKVLGYDTYQIVFDIESGTNTEYWVSDKLPRNPASFENNKFGYVDEIMKVVKSVPLYKKQIVADLFVTIEEAIHIHFETPDAEMFVLPQVNVYHW